MKICIYGAGAIGGLLAARLSLADQDVTVIARGPHLAAIKANGLRLRMAGQEHVAHVRATDDPRTLAPQDFVLITLKSHSVAPAAQAMQPLLDGKTAVVTAMNGIPWWYFYRHVGPFRDHQLKSVDPDGSLWRLIAPERCIGCVVYPAAEIVEPGVIQHQYGNRFMLGEPDGSKSARALRLSEALTKAGFKAPVRPRIRDDIWLKLWGNLSFNPVSALTHATLATIANDPGTRELIRQMMREAQQVAEKLGVKFDIDIETRIGWSADVGEHRTSMLQDLELGRPMEIDALVTVIAEMGDLVGVDTPLIDAVLALVIQRARQAGCYS